MQCDQSDPVARGLVERQRGRRLGCWRTVYAKQGRCGIVTGWLRVMCIVDERYRATRVMNETGADRTQQLPAERPRPSTSDNNHLCVLGRVDESANTAVKEQLGVYVGGVCVTDALQENLRASSMTRNA